MVACKDCSRQFSCQRCHHFPSGCCRVTPVLFGQGHLQSSVLIPADSSRLSAGESSPRCFHRVSPLAVCLLPVKFSLHIYHAVVAKMPKAQPWAAFGLGVPKEASRTHACMVKRVLYLQRRTWTQFPCHTCFYVKI